MSGGSPWSRRVPWIVLAFVIVIALVIGSGAIHGQTEDDRVMAIAATIKCPQCQDESAATSEASEAVAIRNDIAVRLKKGQSADDIRGYYANSYGEQMLLDPGRTGAASLVWILPVLALVAAFGGLGVIFARWRGMATAEASDADRALVARAQVDAASREGGGDAVSVPSGAPEDGPVDPHGEGQGA